MQTTGVPTVIRLGRAVTSMSRKDLAEKTGLAYQTIADIENGHREPNLPDLDRLAAAFDMKTWQVLALADKPKGSIFGKG